jgi:uncharacterized protein
VRFTSARRIVLTLLIAFIAVSPAFGQAGLVISQIYGGGGNSGATFNSDYIELYNNSSAAINLGGLSVQYASATGTSWNAAKLPAVSLPAGKYYLIQAAGGTVGVALPTPDFVMTLADVTSSFTINMSATAGKVALVTNITPLTVSCPTGATILDFIGYGTTANCFEGAGAAPTTSNNTQSIIRKDSTIDTNVNSADFTTVSPPNPRSTGNGGTTAPPPVSVAIHTIQGSKPLTSSTVSPYVGQAITTTGVVTAVLPNGFFIQARDVDADSDPSTPEGIDVFTSTAPPAAAVVGNYVQVTGNVSTFPAVTASHTPATEIVSPTVTVLSTGNPLPTAVTLTASQLTPAGGLYQLTRYEGMRVSIASLTAISGTNGSITAANEPTETATSTGYFYGVITGTARPFREPGIDLRDPPIPGAPTGIAVFDDNPERILVDTSIAGGTSIELSTGAVLPNVTGVLDFTFSADSFYDPSRLILDPSYSRASVVPGMAVQPVPLPASNEFTVASYNVERFYNTASADDLYYVPAGVNGFNGSSGTAILSTGQTFISAAVDVSQAAYTRRLQKLSLTVRTVLNNPDIVTLEEVENQSVANDIAAQINADAGVPNLYTAYSTDNSTYYTQDGTGISVGFLVKNTVNKLNVSQFGALESFTPTTSTSPITLNDRPWLVLSAGIKRANAKDYPVTVVVNHMKALTGENSPTSTSTRQKKELQAEDIAKYIQSLQASGTHVISGGDFNAFEFSDGYADTLATYTNVNVLPSTQVVQPGVAGLVTPPLKDLALNLAANQRWSYVEDGTAQILDHIVVTADLAAAGAHMAYAHSNSDFPVTAYNDATTAARSSDHDIAVGYFAIPAPVLSSTLTPSATTTFASTTIGASSAGQNFTFTNTGEAPVTITSVTTTGDYGAGTNCNNVAVAINSTCTVNVVFTPTAAGARTGTVAFVTSIATNGTFTTSLTGTGATPALPTMLPATQDFASIIIPASSAAKTFTVTNSATVPVAVSSVATTGDFSQTNTCGTSIAASGTCTISVIFKPTAVGARTGTLKVTTTGAAATTLTSTLTGTGLIADFTMGDGAGQPTTSIIAAAGQSVYVPLTFTVANGYSGTITLTCTGPATPPTGVLCSGPASFALTAGSSTQTITLSTTSRIKVGGVAGSSPKALALASLLGFAGLGLLLAGRKARLFGRMGGLLMLALAILLPTVGCGSSGPVANPNGTPAGTYAYTVTATSGTLTHTETINLIVQ